MKTKTAYRPQKPEAEIPAVVVGQPDGSAAAVAVEHHHEPATEPIVEIEREQEAALHEHKAEVTKADEAAAALKRQIEELTRSEALQKQAAQYAAQPQRPLTRDEKLALWRQQGMPDDQAEFLKANPELIDFSELAAWAAGEALQAGHERGSHEHMRAMKEIFDTHLRAQAQQPDPAMTPTPKFFAPPPPKPVRQPGPIVSAPVSRTVPDGSVRPQYEQDPTRVTLTPDEKLLAKASGAHRARMGTRQG
ncbi:MAG: hypothetical protein WB689_25665 [Xanthobacteraceae bacterium]